MKFSMLIPTRGRPDKLTNFLASVYQMTHKKKNLEILIACDNDDPDSQRNVHSLIAKYNRQMEIYLHVRERSEMLNHDYYNWLGAKATGDLIWVLADDLQLVTPGWDNTVANHIEQIFVKYGDRIICVHMLDNTPPPSHRLPKFPCFPMFSKEAREKCGWLLHPKVPTWGADYVSYLIYKPIDRLIEFKDRNYINHISFHNKQEAPDATNARIGQIFNRLKMIPHHNTDRIIQEEVPSISRGLLYEIQQYNKLPKQTN